MPVRPRFGAPTALTQPFRRCLTGHAMLTAHVPDVMHR